MTTPDGFRLWYEGEGFIQPLWYAEAEELAAGLIRLAVAYDALVAARTDDPQHPSVAHVSRLLIPYDAQNYRTWRERLYTQSVEPKSRLLHKEIAAAYRRAGDMVLGVTSRAAVRQCQVDVRELRDRASNPELREIWEKFLDIWEHYVGFVGALDLDGVEDLKRDEWAARRRVRAREQLVAHFREFGYPDPEAEADKQLL